MLSKQSKKRPGGIATGGKKATQLNKVGGLVKVKQKGVKGGGRGGGSDGPPPAGGGGGSNKRMRVLLLREGSPPHEPKKIGEGRGGESLPTKPSFYNKNTVRFFKK